VAMALGYLIGPIIEKRFAKSQQASQRPIFPAQPQSLADLRNRADHGDVEAQWQMAVRYHNGEGVPQDDAQAMLWFQLAAEQGNVDAQSHLGAYYWAGRGVPVDLSKAYMWSEIAVAGGDESSKSRLEGLAFQMTRAQMSDARQQAEAWINQHNTPESSKN
jgi:TPR repeat protein